MTDAEIVIDAVAAAKRVLAARNRKHAALLLSTLEMVAIAERIERLEAVAATAFQLLLKTDALEEAPRQPDGFDTCVRLQALGSEVRALIETLAGALGALGYSQEEANGETQCETGGAGDAGAADA